MYIDNFLENNKQIAFNICINFSSWSVYTLKIRKYIIIILKLPKKDIISKLGILGYTFCFKKISNSSFKKLFNFI